MGMYLIDTNVMLAASAAFAGGGHAERAMPKDSAQRQAIFDWLRGFEGADDDSLVLDEGLLIQEEYEQNMPGWPAQWYGMQVLQWKMDHGLVAWVPIDVSRATGEPVAVLEPPYEAAVRDPADRKWVACALSAATLYESVPPIVYAAESDWYKAEPELLPLGIRVKRLLPDAWYTRSGRHK